MPDSSQHVIEEGDQIILKKAENLRLFKVKRKRQIWLDRTKFFLDGIIGHPYGCRFEVKDSQMIKVTKAAPQNVDSTEKGPDTDRDNRNLHDVDSNQKLTADKIDQMKKEGVSGEKLIEHLIENSATFQDKTEYAQEKWVKKKKKKHISEFTVLKPTSRLLCELYWSKGPSRICNLRIDTLAQILTWSNVQAHSTVAVVDSCLGLVTGAVMERLAGFGKVVCFYHGGNPVRAPLDAYNFTPKERDTLFMYPLEQLNAVHAAKMSGTKPTPDTKNVQEEKGDAENLNEIASGDTNKKREGTDNAENLTNKAKDDKTNECEGTDSVKNLTEKAKDSVVENSKDETQDSEMSVDTDAKQTAGIAEDSMKPEEDLVAEEGKECDTENDKKSRKEGGKKRKTIEERDASREERHKEIERAREVLLQGNIDCLIVASKFHPTPIVTSLVDFLAPSRQVVVFSQFKEALQDCYVYLREHGGLVNYRLTETWLRNYQVLPNRTHPVIQMSGTGGYLLTATAVIKQSSPSGTA